MTQAITGRVPFVSLTDGLGSGPEVKILLWYDFSDGNLFFLGFILMNLKMQTEFYLDLDASCKRTILHSIVFGATNKDKKLL